MKNRIRQRANSKLKKKTVCLLRRCAGNKEGFCRVLNCTDFEGKVCPFFKTVEQNEQEKKAVMERLVAMDRQDLIELYYGEKAGVSNGC